MKRLPIQTQEIVAICLYSLCFFFECFPCFIIKLCQVYQKVAINLRAGGEYLNLLTQIIAKYSQQKKVLSKINSQREVKNK